MTECRRYHCARPRNRYGRRLLSSAIQVATQNLSLIGACYAASGVIDLCIRKSIAEYCLRLTESCRRARSSGIGCPSTTLADDFRLNDQSQSLKDYRIAAMEESEGFVVRRPRHEVLDKAGCQITVEWIASARRLEADLSDVSRQGLKLVVDRHIPPDSRIRLCLEQKANRFSVTLPVTVCRSRLEDDGRWGIGGIFDRELSWELMGELFLNGILSAEAMKSGHASRKIRPEADGLGVFFGVGLRVTARLSSEKDSRPFTSTVEFRVDRK